MTTPKQTVKQAAQAALDVQNASNLSGVARSFAMVTETLWDEARRQNKGTDFVNQHPIAQLFIDKMASLARIQGIDANSVTVFSKAYDECGRLAAEPVTAQED